MSLIHLGALLAKASKPNQEPPVHITDEQSNDIRQITRIQYNAFNGHPIHAGAEPIEHLIVERLRDAGALTLSLLAEQDGEQVGHIAISPCTIGENRHGWYLLGPVGVLPDHQGKGIGSALIRESLRRFCDMGADGIGLVGDPEFYKRFGFTNHPGITYDGVPAQYVLALPFNDSDAEGNIIAHEAFSTAP